MSEEIRSETSGEWQTLRAWNFFLRPALCRYALSFWTYMLVMISIDEPWVDWGTTLS